MKATRWIDFPVPPSANHLYRNATGRDGRTVRVLSKAYRLWRSSAAELMAAQSQPMPRDTPLMVEIVVSIDRRRDLDNCAKPVLDALQAAGIIGDDRWVDSLKLDRSPPGGLCSARCSLFRPASKST